ncbi:hypothetical protein FPV67DRAFT_315997 [Lyophyllum atratum]|nr:hypothetical protein FPV67DRAFT_315997 [Lyophyllum atratum]
MLRIQTNDQMPVNNLQSQGQFLHFHYTTDADYAFTTAPPTMHSLTPHQEFSSAEFETPTVYQYSETPSPSDQYSQTPSPSDSFPLSPLYEENQTTHYPPARKAAPRLRSGNRVPRPRNAFMIFRSEFWANSKISKSVEHDHRHISRIIGHCWNQLPEEEKDTWRRRAEQEKIEHGEKYPGYRFSPNTRTKQVVRRNVKRNGKDELLRCKQVAELLLAGKAGKELDHAVQSIDSSSGREISPPLLFKKEPSHPLSDRNDAPVFRSPLLPPAQSQEISPPCEYSCQIPTASNSSSDYQVKRSSSPEQDWTFRYPTAQLTGQEDTSYTSQYLIQHQIPITWVSSQEPNNLGYSTPAEAYHGAPPMNSIYHTSPRSSPFHIEFINPFDYRAPNPPAVAHGHMIQPPIDPLQWNLSPHGAN